MTDRESESKVKTEGNEQRVKMLNLSDMREPPQEASSSFPRRNGDGGDYSLRTGSFGPNPLPSPSPANANVRIPIPPSSFPFPRSSRPLGRGSSPSPTQESRHADYENHVTPYWLEVKKKEEAQANAKYWRDAFKDEQKYSYNLEWSLDEAEKEQNRLREEIETLLDQRLPAYPEEASPRGLCLLVNNQNFKDSDIRHGSGLDLAKLHDLFWELDFKVWSYKNLKRDEMLSVFRETASRNHTSYDMFVSVIMTHGTNDRLQAIDERFVSIEDLTDEFLPKNCPGLSGKPKIFIIQSCRGEGALGGIAPNQASRDGSCFDSALGRSTIPEESDYLLAFCTTPGFVAYRHKEEGSLYIQSLVDVVRKYHHSTHLLDMLTEVNRRVARKEFGDQAGKLKQMPAPVHTLRKQVFL